MIYKWKNLPNKKVLLKMIKETRKKQKRAKTLTELETLHEIENFLIWLGLQFYDNKN